MLNKLTVKPNQVAQIFKSGRYVKIINSELSLVMRVYSGGSLLLETEVRAGFEITFDGFFESITFESKQDQKAEVWVSKNKLSFAAPTAGANNNTSYLFKHYGDLEQLLPFEPNRIKVLIKSDVFDFWYGGEGLDFNNGMKVLAGKEVEIIGAGAINVLVNEKSSYSISQDDTQTETMTPRTNAGYNSSIKNTPKGIFMVSGDNKIYKFNETTSSYDMIHADGLAYKYDYIEYHNGELYGLGWGESVVHAFDLETFAKRDIVITSVLKYGMMSVNNVLYFLFIESNRRVWREAFSNSSILIDMSSSADIFPMSTGVFLITASKIYFYDFASIPQTLDIGGLPVSTIGVIEGTIQSAQITENDDYYVISSKEINSQVVAVDKQTMIGGVLGYFNVGFATTEGITTFNGSQLKEWVYNNGWSSSASTAQTRSLSSGSSVMAFFITSSFVFVGDYGVLEYDIVKKRENEKVKIRVFKATV